LQRSNDNFTTARAARELRGRILVEIHSDSTLNADVTWRAGAFDAKKLLGELGDAMSEPRNFAAGIVLVHDAALRRPHDHRLGRL